MSVKEFGSNITWQDHLKKYIKEHGVSFKQALTDAKPSYDEISKKECKNLSVPDECNARDDECMINKSNKCQKRPTPSSSSSAAAAASRAEPRPVVSIKSKKRSSPSKPPKKHTRKAANKLDVDAVESPSPSPSPVKLDKSFPDDEHELDEHHIPAMKHKKCIAEQEEKRNELREARNAYDSKIKECEEILYGELISTYFTHLETNKLTHIDLLKGLQRFYTDNKKSNTDYILTLDGFIRLFSQKTAVQGANYKRQHIFEAICRLLLLFNYDRNMFGTNKKFYTSLEEFSKKPTTTSIEEILETPVNVSSKAGIVDIFFRAENKNKTPSAAEAASSDGVEEESVDNDEWACESIDTISKSRTPSKKYNYIMIQNKYYEVEKSNISHYDVTRIYTLASKYEEHDKIFDDGEAKIVLMVNNEDAVSSNLMRAKQQYQGLFAEGEQGIIGVKRLNDWFETLLFDLLESKSITEFKEHVGLKAAATKPLLQPRFHQKFIIDCTEKYIQGTSLELEGEAPVSKFIWGAVPRSGKSFMIGGLISNRSKRPENKDNDIVIILGAKTETESQFVRMFKTFQDFSHYNIYVGGRSKQDAQAAGKPTIYLFSQEYLKMKCEWKADVSTATFKEKEGKDLKSRFEGRNIDLYFDEIHKGGSTDNSQSVIYTFKNNKVGINIFIMVTATFAKPSAKYDGLNFIGKGQTSTKIIEWSYNDQQHMKKISDATKLEMFINTRSKTQKEVLKETFHHYREYYGASYLTVLTSEYSKYPELVILSPQSIELDVRAPAPDITLADLSTEDIRNCFTGNLHCAACKVGEPVNFYKDYRNVFHNVRPVKNVLEFISGNIRNYMKNVVKYPVDSPHTELWFLPDKRLYPSDADCKSNGCTPVVTDESLEADDTEKEAKFGIANIEPLTRGLAYMITEEPPEENPKKNTRFSDYNVFIVHNTPFNYLGSAITSSSLFGDKIDNITGRKRIGVYDNKKGGLSDQIKAFERESYKHGKSVIVLTGAKLRLGISLPCADIAFNFDDIKSIDSNYQTMFRVLTEREKPKVKNYGYYFDFNRERSIQFLYEYNKTYGESKKKSNIQENLEELQSLLFTFNYNGLNIIKKDTATEIGLYKKLITELNLTEEGYKEFWIKKENIVGLLKKVLNISGNDELVKELYKVLKMSKMTVNKDKELVVLKEGEKRQEMPKMVVHNADESETDDGADDGAAAAAAAIDAEEAADVEDYGEIVNQVAESLPTIIALLAMFSVDTKYNSVCENIEECLRQSVDKILDGASRCTCENINESIDSVDILDCFFNSGKRSEGEERQEDEMADAEADGDEPIEGGAGKPKKSSTAQKQSTKRQPKSALDEMKKNERRKYTTHELKHIMEILLQIITSKNDDEFTSAINNIFDTIRESVNTMPKHKDGDGKHGLIYGMTPDDVETKITSYLSVRDEEKDKFGEVFTPMKLINEMFDKLPHAVWADPDKKWLDPANGIGNFPMVAYMRLMKGLSQKIPDDQKRSKHIIENMLYMVEINPKNVKISRRIFGSAANICCADVLNEQDKVRREFREVDKFDVIIGNPPFQDEIDTTSKNDPTKGSGPRKGGKNKLYERITIECIGLLNTGGYLIFVTPDNIMTGNTNTAYEEIIKHHAIYVSLNNIQKRFFPTVGQSMCYFLIQTKQSGNNGGLTSIESSSDKEPIKVLLENRSINPVNNWTLQNEKLVDMYITDTKNGFTRTKDGVAIRPVKEGAITVIVNSNKEFKTNEKEVEGYKIPKYILYRMQPSSQGRLDKSGVLGLSAQIYFLPLNEYTKKQIESIDRFFKSDIYKTLQQLTTTGQYLKDAFIKHLNINKILKVTSATSKIQAVVRTHQQTKKASALVAAADKEKKGGRSRRNGRTSIRRRTSTHKTHKRRS